MAKEEESKKILLYAWIKYRRTNKNVILLLKFDLRRVIIYITFYETKIMKFMVYHIFIKTFN